MSALVNVEGLSIAYGRGAERRRIVHEVAFSIAAGETVALVGESGSGKTTTAQALIGLLPGGGHVEAGSIRLHGLDVPRAPEGRWRAIRGASISLVPQDPGGSLNPVRTIGDQVGEVFDIHRGTHGALTRLARDERVHDLLERVGLSQPALRMGQYPHELSGGMKQRVLIAIAIALKPDLIIADEPTSALDVSVQQRILSLIDDLRRENGTALLLVTHDLGIAAERADRLLVMQGGRIREAGRAAQVLASPQSAYTRQLLADAPRFTAPRHRPSPPRSAGPPAIVVENLVQDFATGGRTGPFRAVDRLSFTVAPGTTHALVGESGSGKTTTARAVVGFQKPSGGRIVVAGIDLASLSGTTWRAFRRTIQLVYQNPFASLDPRQKVGAIIEEPLLNFDPVPARDRQRRVQQLLERVGLPGELATRPPAALSGGQRQRVAIARALILQPRILVLDEAVSALDVTVQAQILTLLDDLQRELGLTYLFVSHDLAVVRQMADTVSVLRAGRCVECGEAEQVFAAPRDSYTRQLVEAVPRGFASPAADPAITDIASTGVH